MLVLILAWGVSPGRALHRAALRKVETSSPRGPQPARRRGSTLLGEAVALCVFLPGLVPRASINHSFPFLREVLCCAAISKNKILRIVGLVSRLFRRLRSEKVAPSGQLKTNDLRNIDNFCRCGGGKRLGENGGLPPMSARLTAFFSIPVESGNRLAVPFFRVLGLPPRAIRLGEPARSQAPRSWSCLEQSPAAPARHLFSSAGRVAGSAGPGGR